MRLHAFTLHSVLGYISPDRYEEINAPHRRLRYGDEDGVGDHGEGDEVEADSEGHGGQGGFSPVITDHPGGDEHGSADGGRDGRPALSGGGCLWHGGVILSLQP